MRGLVPVYWQFRFMVQSAKKCTMVDDRLVCSQEYHEEKGFVYFPKKNRLYVLDHGHSEGEGLLGSVYWTEFGIYSCADMEPSNKARTPQSFTCLNEKRIKRYVCYSGSFVVLHYEDKYGFPKSDRIQTKSRRFCEEKFEELLP